MPVAASAAALRHQHAHGDRDGAADPCRALAGDRGAPEALPRLEHSGADEQQADQGWSPFAREDGREEGGRSHRGHDHTGPHPPSVRLPPHHASTEIHAGRDRCDPVRARTTVASETTTGEPAPSAGGSGTQLPGCVPVPPVGLAPTGAQAREVALDHRVAIGHAAAERELRPETERSPAGCVRSTRGRVGCASCRSSTRSRRCTTAGGRSRRDTPCPRRSPAS